MGPGAVNIPAVRAAVRPKSLARDTWSRLVQDCAIFHMKRRGESEADCHGCNRRVLLDLAESGQGIDPELIREVTSLVEDRLEGSMPAAIGLIEVEGVAGIILAADAAVKTADVDLLGWDSIGGFTTVLFGGSISDVGAALASGTKQLVRS